MTVVLLVRHGTCDPVGRFLAGRTPGISLNAAGRRQADALAAALGPLRLEGIYSSPLERARETAQALAAPTGATVQELAGLVELDYGEWTGRSLASLADDPIWQEYNLRRGAVRIPAGETMSEVVARATEALAAISTIHPAGLVAAVTHGDVIRGLLACWAGIGLDGMLQLEVAPGSVSVVGLGSPPRLLAVNWMPALRDLL